MNQIFSFKKFLERPILDGIKCYTTRLETPYRLKCNIGSIMYLYTGIRTKDANKFGEAIVRERWAWSINLPVECPAGISWDDFSIAEGFNNIDELKEFFTKKYITYKFELLKMKSWMKSILEYLEDTK